MSYRQQYLSASKLTKDNVHKKLSGVCAGIANYYNWPRWGVRIVAILALLTFPLATGVAYLVAATLMPNK